MPPERWPAIERLYHAACALPAGDRAAFLARECGGDAALQREVESLLAEDGATPHFLSEPALAVAGAQFADATRSNLIGRRIGTYEIQALLGAGGMGEVYRARDIQLGRDVAIKVLPSAFLADRDRLARLEREARVLASLNHAHIGAIYGLERVDHSPVLVLELVNGEMLAERIARGPIPVDEALQIARQIADALAAAHEHGIIHRDLKPTNIKVTDGDTVKVLDFGLAKAAGPAAASSADAMSAPTLEPHATQPGIILGTAAYMSPEQAAGKPVDKRSDLWAFGAVLLEMLTGRQVFKGDTASHVLAAVLKDDPDWTTLPANTAASIRRLLRRCLEKDRNQRLADAANARLEIDDALKRPDETIAPAKMPARRLAMVAASALAGGALVAASAMWFVIRPSPVRLPPIMRFAIVAVSPQAPLINGADRDLALSPDGTHLVYVSGSDSGTQLMVRAMDRLDAVPLAGITGIRSPFISPDGLWVGFFAGSMTGEIRKVSVTGGPSISLCRFQGTPRGASWGPDGTITSLRPVTRPPDCSACRRPAASPMC